MNKIRPGPPHLARLGLSGFLCFKKQSPVGLGRLNVFIGKNSSGKSTVLHALSLLSAAANSASPQTSMLFSGNGINLGSYEDVVFGNDVDSSFAFDLEMEPVGEHELIASDRMGALGRFPTRLKLTFRLDDISKRPFLSAVSAWAPDLGRCFTLQGFSAHGTPSYHAGDAPGYRTRPAALAPRFRHFLPYFSRHHTEHDSSFKTMLPFYKVNHASNRIYNFFEDLVYLGPSRSSLDVVYFPAGAFPSKLDSTGANLVPLVLGQVRTKREMVTFWRTLNEWLGRRFGLVDSARLDPYAAGFGFRLQGRDPTLKAHVSLANTGFGVSQVLPLVVQLALKRPGPLVVEQPELHLHPAAQAELGDLLVELAAGGSQLFVETHSEHLILRLRSLAASGILKKKGFREGDLRIFHVEKGKDGSSLREVAVDASGRLSGWPRGFFSASADDILAILGASADD